MPFPCRLVLVGAGHAHLEVLRRLAEDDHPPIGLTVVSATPRQLYSGMVPGFLYGVYRKEEISVEVAPLVERAGGRLVPGRATEVSAERREVTVATDAASGQLTETIPYDLLSLNIGSRTVGEDTPGVTEHATVVKPIQQALGLRERIETLAALPATRTADGTEGRRAVVVGAGAAGVEVACALATALDRVRPRVADEDAVTLLEAGPRILPGESRRVHDRARAVLEGRGIDIRCRARVTAVDAGGVSIEALGRSSHLPAALTVWVTGAAPPPLLATLARPTDERGFLLVDETLRSPADERIYGAGDCVTLAHRPETAKAGVYAVRQAPVLWASLTAAIADSAQLPAYRPQKQFLSILNTADGRALLRWRGFVSHSRWAWKLKDWIDRRFLGKYREG